MASLSRLLGAALLAASLVGPSLASGVRGSPAVADDPLPIVKGLSVSVVARPPSGPAVRVSQPYGRKGPTSVRFFPADARRLSRPSPNPADPPGSRYLVKDRDLGQTFRTPPGPAFRLDAVTLRVGPAPLGDVAGIAGAAGAPVFLQVFEVAGAPAIHDNGTTGTTTVSVSYPGKAMADDYVTGETYRTLLVATGGALPAAITVGESNTPVATLESAGTLLRFDVTRTGGVVLQPGRQYAFMVGFESAAADRALPIDNYDYLNQPGVPEDSTAAGPYEGGHAIRREGRVERPQDHLALALSEDNAPSLFPPGLAERLRQQPGTWGRPDVDTYRDLTFWLEGTEEAAAAGGGGVVLGLVEAAPSGPRVVASHAGFDSSGNTSVAHDRADIYKWSGASPHAHEDWGYFTPDGREIPYVKRDRDLGQTFVYRGEQPARLDAVTVRTGFGSNVVRPGAYGQAVSLQLFRVTGAPVLHDNGTTGATRALHGFPHDRPGGAIPSERDDYVTGEAYAPLLRAAGARFPSKADFGFPETAVVDPNHGRLKGRYLRWDLEGASEVVLEPGATYAFLILIDEIGEERGFTLANSYQGSYEGGHGIRRDGNGAFPPVPADPSRAFTDPANAVALAAAHFPADMAARTAIAPGTDGYPDVDTWRDLTFWVEVAAPTEPPVVASAFSEAFERPSEATRPSVYWYWLCGHISRDGITRDLEAMRRVGIGEALLANVDECYGERGSVRLFTPEWRASMEHAMREGARTGVKIGLFNGPGWSQSGGPWVRPDQAMRYLTFAELPLRGPATVQVRLPAPGADFQDVATLAIPLGASGAHRSNVATRVVAPRGTSDASVLSDGRLGQAWAREIPAGETAATAYEIELHFEKPFQAQSIQVHPGGFPFSAEIELQGLDDRRRWVTMRQFRCKRVQSRPELGPKPFGPIAESVRGSLTDRYRLLVRPLPLANGSVVTPVFSEVEISPEPVVERFVEKQLGKLFEEPQPLWDSYMWPRPIEPVDAAAVAQPESVVNLSAMVGRDGSLSWEVPEGHWLVQRFGMRPTGARNAPAAPEARGLEVDKMSRGALSAHVEAYIGKLLEGLPDDARGNVSRIVADSYETGSNNWTDEFASRFRETYDYDPVPYLPVLTGRLVGGAERSDRFLWDLRRLVADRVASEYVGGLREEAGKRGLKLWLENYGHWGFPGEFLQYGGRSDEVGGEFWMDSPLGDVELRAASSCAHIYGKPRVSAEAFTAADRPFQRGLGDLQVAADKAATEGVNHFVLHVYIHQPDERVPGVNAWFGTEFNRHNTWFHLMGPWIDSLRRTHAVLQEGLSVADIAYFIGEDVPKMTGVREPEIPPGFAYDYINAEVIERDLRVENGRLVLPSGMSYRLLVLPPGESMRPRLVEKLRHLVAAGGAIFGPPPTRSPSLQGYPECDREVRALAAGLWPADGSDRRRHGPAAAGGWVFTGSSLEAAARALGLVPDVIGLDRASTPWIHRRSGASEAYFVSNQTQERQELRPGFRVTGLQPEVWDPARRTRRPLRPFSDDGRHTWVPISLAAGQSMLLVFERSSDSPAPAAGQRLVGRPATLNPGGRWSIRFDPGQRGEALPLDGPLRDWSQHPDPDVRHHSGTVIYRTRFDHTAEASSVDTLLSLGTVHGAARVRLNGEDRGLLWTAPWSLEVGDALRNGTNELEIEVTNPWFNRLAGDAALPPGERRTWTPDQRVDAGARLLPFGLIGPVTLSPIALQPE